MRSSALKSHWADGRTYVSTTLSRAKVLAFSGDIKGEASPRLKLQMLERGSCEPLKAGVHAMTLALAAIMTLYNTAAWIRRRQTHLAVNSVLYAALTEWERKQVAHHLALRR
jgi:hypothetical protein